MNERLSQALERAKSGWANLPQPRRFAVLGSAALFVALLSYLIFSAGANTRFGVLFTGLQPVDAAAVLQYLQEQQIPYQVSDDGRDFWIPEESVSEIRLHLASQGYPTSGVVGFESLDQLPLGLTEAQWNEMYARAISGELTRTIEWLDAVQSARVLITPARASVYRTQREPARASITLRLHPGRTLTPAQVRAITQLAVSSVEGLTEEWVSIVDQSGNLLSDMLLADTYTGTDVISQRLALTREYERSLEHAILAQLSAYAGSGGVVAQVRAELNFDLFREESEVFASPTGGSSGIPRSEQFISETYRGDQTSVGGIAGVASNIPGYPEASPTQTGEYDYREEIINYELNRTLTVREEIPGNVKRLSIAVLIDGSLDAATLDELTNQVAAIAGAVPDRDTVVVDSLPFASMSDDGFPVLASPQPASTIPSGWLLAGAAALLLILLVALLVRRPAPVAEPERTQSEEDEEIELWTSPELTAAERRKQGIRKELETFAGERPQEMARLLRGWLTDD